MNPIFSFATSVVQQAFQVQRLCSSSIIVYWTWFWFFYL